MLKFYNDWLNEKHFVRKDLKKLLKNSDKKDYNQLKSSLIKIINKPENSIKLEEMGIIELEAEKQRTKEKLIGYINQLIITI